MITPVWEAFGPQNNPIIPSPFELKGQKNGKMIKEYQGDVPPHDIQDEALFFTPLMARLPS